MSENAPLKKFVTETEIEEKRKIRQEEWEKVRQPHQPIEVPDEPIETRSLFEQLQAQKDQKELDHEEQHRMRNQVRGLDKEEADFLDFVVEKQQEREKEKYLEECEVLQEFRNSVANRSATTELSTRNDEKLTSDKTATGSSKKRTSQAELLAGAVKRKRSDDMNAESQNAKKSCDNTQSQDTSPISASIAADSSTKPPDVAVDAKPASASPDSNANGVARVVGVLPGLGYYTDSDDSDSSSSDSDIDTDLFRRDHIVHKPGQEIGSATVHRHR